MEILTTETYEKWFRKLKDRQARARISLALRRCQLEDRLVGDVKSVGDQIYEMRFHFGPGYRLYYLLQERTVVVLLVGGDKASQDADIAKAKALAADLRKEKQWP
ncbi:type II toxin-antitoxin system RelE/ParE family toxin [Luteococcus sp. H138]|uniref:type II toxin-antitoxin system RelE/ParE family toxin n=1 Tax=unclassified Luteococcus TaxID=2639923 RepID=UPI00313D4C96